MVYDCGLPNIVDLLKVICKARAHGPDVPACNTKSWHLLFNPSSSRCVAKLNNRVWNNSKLTENTKLRIYQACVLSSFLYSSKTWTTYRRQEKRLNSFHLRCLRRILRIHWQDRITNFELLERAGIPSIFAILSKRRLTWLGLAWTLAASQRTYCMEN